MTSGDIGYNGLAAFVSRHSPSGIATGQKVAALVGAYS